jgi:hypothetical protein
MLAKSGVSLSYMLIIVPRFAVEHLKMAALIPYPERHTAVVSLRFNILSALYVQFCVVWGLFKNFSHKTEPRFFPII